ncbi:redoxin domain-containing protein, partial [bacterium]
KLNSKRLLSFLLIGVAVAVIGFAVRPDAEVRAAGKNNAAPELVGKQWLNTPGNAPISLEARRGKVTILEFWTFGCSNCRANLSAYAKWAREFKDQDVEVIGVHTPELDNERDPANVAAMVEQLGITYPVLLDTQGANWNRYKTRYWPTVYVIDQQNVIRAKWEGELEYGGAGGTAQITRTVRNLLAAHE